MHYVVLWLMLFENVKQSAVELFNFSGPASGDITGIVNMFEGTYTLVTVAIAVDLYALVLLVWFTYLEVPVHWLLWSLQQICT